MFVTLAKLDRMTGNEDLVDKVCRWAAANMLDEKGYFYYQLKHGVSSKISYMRWSNAFMFASLAFLVENQCS